jgi:DUF4097 and DUF4098 domain-containing protein YvlB
MKWRIWAGVLPAILILPLGLFGKCPISPNGRLELLAPAGNLVVETSGTDSVEVEVANRQVVVKEECTNKDLVVITGTLTSAAGLPEWKIKVPRGVSLDLSTQGGSIQVGDTDGKETFLRTSGGGVTTGLIKGKALIRANEVRTGDIGGDVEVRGQGGRLQVGNVGGNAQFSSTGGDIAMGLVKGTVKADTGSGSIMIRESNGDVLVTTQAGDITSSYVRGGFDGKTANGNIRLDKVGSWVHAFTGVGDIFFKLSPIDLAKDFHVKAEAGVGSITMYVPEKINATIDAIIDHSSFGATRIVSDFKKVTTAPASAIWGLVPGRNKEAQPVRGFTSGAPDEQARSILGNGGNQMKLRASSGSINIRILKGN